METGKVVDIIAASQGEEQQQAAVAWRALGHATDAAAVAKVTECTICTSDQAMSSSICELSDLQSDDGEVVHIMDSEQRIVATVFVTPPHQIRVETLRVSITMKRLAVFSNSNQFLVYELII